MTILTQSQAVEFTKAVSKKQEEAPVTLADFDPDFSFASDEEVAAVFGKWGVDVKG